MSEDDEKIEAFFAPARGAPFIPDALMARVVAQGVRMQPPPPARPVRAGCWLVGLLGGWRYAGGLAGAAAFGLVTGYVQPFEIVTSSQAIETYEILPDATAGFGLWTGE